MRRRTTITETTFTTKEIAALIAIAATIDPTGYSLTTVAAVAKAKAFMDDENIATFRVVKG